METVVLYGAGKICNNVLPFLSGKYSIQAIIDNNKNGTFNGIPIISVDEYSEHYSDYRIIMTLNPKHEAEAIEQLGVMGISGAISYREAVSKADSDKMRLISYSQLGQNEDLILYSVLKDYDNIFYIDVGCNDPVIDSVTKLFYDIKNAHGINIDPQERLISYADNERPRDINLCCAVSDECGNSNVYIQSGITTLLEENIIDELYEKTTSVLTRKLSDICKEYISGEQVIHFLKIDVEGYERKVLLSADFNKYRPMIIVLESTYPNTDIPCFDKWEDILLDNKYHLAFEFGVNRYYTADEHSELDSRFRSATELADEYALYHYSMMG